MPHWRQKPPIIGSSNPVRCSWAHCLAIHSQSLVSLGRKFLERAGCAQPNSIVLVRISHDCRMAKVALRGMTMIQPRLLRIAKLFVCIAWLCGSSCAGADPTILVVRIRYLMVHHLFCTYVLHIVYTYLMRCQKASIKKNYISMTQHGTQST